MRQNFKLLSFVVAVFALSSCNEIEDYSFDHEYEYYPLEIGHFVIYDVDSIVFDDFTGTSDTFNYQKMHVIDSAFTDNSGRQAHKIIRYQRSNSTQPWLLSDVWQAVQTQSSLEVVEENQRFIKLLFPPEEGQSWHGHKYLDIVDGNEWMENWEYSITALNVAENINGLQLDSTLTVLQHDEENLIEKYYGEEKYAKHVGLVYKKLINLEKQNITAPWTKPEKGFILTMTLLDYGPK